MNKFKRAIIQRQVAFIKKLASHIERVPMTNEVRGKINYWYQRNLLNPVAVKHMIKHMRLARVSRVFRATLPVVKEHQPARPYGNHLEFDIKFKMVLATCKIANEDHSRLYNMYTCYINGGRIWHKCSQAKDTDTAGVVAMTLAFL